MLHGSDVFTVQNVANAQQRFLLEISLRWENVMQMCQWTKFNCCTVQSIGAQLGV